MRPVVLAYLPVFNTKFESKLDFMYLDNHVDENGEPDPLVTCGIGNLCEPIDVALRMAWVNPDGTPTSTNDIAAAWRAVKARTDLAPGGGAGFASVTTIRLSDRTVAGLESEQVDANERILRSYFPRWDSFPADAQLGIHSMAYAMGAGFPAGFPKFTAACNAGDWQTASVECRINRNAPAARNAADRLLFQNAARGKDPSRLYYPSVATQGTSGLATGVVLGFAAWGAWHLYHHFYGGSS